ncbi:hypothetical protein BDP27DRAFT_502828 [Rhodocollybia butyracea]|uniref:Uncharacterized protein n=1 Tax=Rhodocollybia butyracea TaxID=206335 RepID=A0A9P5TYL0_9AGAR|nr:hypothetical protein BDP27DRAFT_502828 [Rhodocollybia butyracea]
MLIALTISGLSNDGDAADPPSEEWKMETLIPALPSRLNICQPGSDACQGDLVMRRGERISSSGGEVVALLSTGSKIRDLTGRVSTTAGEGD